MNIPSLLRTFRKRFFGGTPPRRQTYRRSRLLLEPLEARELPSATPAILAVTDLTPPGSANNPEITVQFSEAMDPRDQVPANYLLFNSSGTQVTIPSTTLTAATDNVQTSITVASTKGFPTTTPFPIYVDSEAMLVTGVSGTTLTVERGVNGTMASTHNAGALASPFSYNGTTNTATIDLSTAANLPAGAYTLFLKGDQIFNAGDTAALASQGQLVVANAGLSNVTGNALEPGPASVSTISVSPSGPLDTISSYPLPYVSPSTVTSIAATNQPLLITVADFNGDHINDVAIANNYTNTVDIYQGLANGQFPSTPTYTLPMPGAGPHKIVNILAFNPTTSAIAQPNFVGPDIAVVDQPIGLQGQLVVFVNQTAQGGPIKFANGTTYSTPAGVTSPTMLNGLVADDFDDNGTVDLAVANRNLDGTVGNGTFDVYVYGGNGDGTFNIPPPPFVGPPTKGTTIVVGQEFTFKDAAGNLIEAGIGLFGPTDLAAGPLNTNGNFDGLAVVGTGNDGLGFTAPGTMGLMTITNGSAPNNFGFTPGGVIGTSSPPDHVAMGKIASYDASSGGFDSSVDDIVVTQPGATNNPTLTVFTNNGTGGFAASATLALNESALSLSLAQLGPVNAKGQPTGPVDILIPNNSNNAFEVIQNTAPALSTPILAAYTYTVDNSPVAVAVGGAGNSPDAGLGVGYVPVAFDGGDINVNGIPAVLTANIGENGNNLTGLSFTVARGAGTATFLQAGGGGTFSAASFFDASTNIEAGLATSAAAPPSPAPGAVAVGDLNGDGIPDYVVADSVIPPGGGPATGLNQVEVYLGSPPARPGGPVTYGSNLADNVDVGNPRTTLTAPVDLSQTTITVASTTAFASAFGAASFTIQIDAETMTATVTGPTTLGVTRAVNGTFPSTHAVGAVVTVPPSTFISLLVPLGFVETGSTIQVDSEKMIVQAIIPPPAGSTIETLEVERGVDGTSPGPHLIGAVVHLVDIIPVTNAGGNGEGPISVTLANLTGTFWPNGEPKLDIVTADNTDSNVSILPNEGNDASGVPIFGSAVVVPVGEAPTQVIAGLFKKGDTILSGAINSTQTSIIVASTQDFPATGSFPIQIDSETMLVTAVSGTTLTVERGVDGTVAAGHSNAALVQANAVTTLTAGIGAADTSISVVSTAGLPTSAGFRIQIGSEIMLATVADATTLNVVRGVAGTMPAAHTSGAVVFEVKAADDLIVSQAGSGGNNFGISVLVNANTGLPPATTTLTAGTDNVQTSITVASTAFLPPTGSFPIQIDSEIMLATVTSPTTLTVVRGADNTTPAGHTDGAVLVFGFLSSPLSLSAGDAVTAVAAGDFNDDGNLDLAFSVLNADGPTTGPGSVVVVTGDGAGNFTSFGSALPIAADPGVLAVADVNRDGYPDIIVGSKSTNDPNEAIGVLLNTVGSGFRPAIYSAMPNGVPIDSLAVTVLPSSSAQKVTVSTALPGNISTNQTNIVIPFTPGLPAVTQGPPPSGGFLLKIDSETMLVTAITPVAPAGSAPGTPATEEILTVVRGVNSQAAAHSAGATVRLSFLPPDAFPDLVVGTIPIPPTVPITPVVDNVYTLTGVGDGTFVTPTPYEAGGPPTPATVAVVSNPLVQLVTFFKGGTLVSDNLVQNGTFAIRDLNGEQGNLVGWQTSAVQDSNGGWNAQTATSAGSFSPLSQVPVPAPPPNDPFQAMLDEPDLAPVGSPLSSLEDTAASYQGANFFYQDVAIPADATSAQLTLSLVIDNLANTYATGPSGNSPDGLDYRTLLPDQQVRVDVMDPNAPITSTVVHTSANNPGVYLFPSSIPGQPAGPVFLTNQSTPLDTKTRLSIGPIDLTAPVGASSLAGQTIRIRIAVVNNLGKLVVGVNDVSLHVTYDEASSSSYAPTLTGLALRNPGFTAAGSAITTTTDPTVIGQVGDGVAVTNNSAFIPSGSGVNNVEYIAFDPRPIAVTGTFVAGSMQVTAASAAGLAVGMELSGPGIPTNTTISAVTGTTLTLSQSTTAAETAVSLSAFGFSDASVFKTNFFDAVGNYSVTLPNLPAGPSTIGVRVQDFAGKQYNSVIQFANEGLNTQSWEGAGPGSISTGAEANISYSSVSGDVTAVATDPYDPSGDTYLIGSANGGLWRTTDGGVSWTPLTDYLTSGPNGTGQPINTPIGAIAFAPPRTLPNGSLAPKTVYAATGVGNDLPYARGGVGILVSNQDGQPGTWSVLASTGTVFAGAQVTAMAVANTAPPTLLSASITSTQTSITVASVARFPVAANFLIQIDSELMQVTAIHGNTFTVQRGAEGTTAAVHTGGALVNIPNQIYVAVAAGGEFGQGVYRSLDGGRTWTNILTLASMIVPNGITAPSTLASVTSLVIDPRDTHNVTIGLGNISLVPDSTSAGVWTSANADTTVAPGPTWIPLLGGDNANIMNDTLPSDLQTAGAVTIGRVTVAEGFSSATAGPGANIATFYVLIGNPSHQSPEVEGGSVDYGTGLNPDPVTGATVAGLYQSPDGGLDWTHVMLRTNMPTAAGLPNFQDINLLGNDTNNVGQLIVDPTDPNVVYVGGADTPLSSFPTAYQAAAVNEPSVGLIRVDTGDMRGVNWYLQTKADPNLALPITGTAAPDPTNNGDDLIKVGAALVFVKGLPVFQYAILDAKGNPVPYTGEGVAWYDLESNSYSPNSEPTPALPAALAGAAAFTVPTLSRLPAEVQSLALDPQGRLLIGTQEGVWRAIYHGVGYDYTSGGTGINGGTTPTPAVSITTINGNLQISELTSVASDPLLSGEYFASAYDTGTMMTTGGLNWQTMGLNGPDSGPVPYSSVDAGTVLVGPPDPTAPGIPTTVYRDFAYTQSGEGYFPETSTQNGALASWLVADSPGISINDSAGYFPVLVIDPTKIFNSGVFQDVLLFGTDRIYESRTSGNLWVDKVGHPLSSAGGVITAAAIAQSNLSVIYAGTNLGEVFVTLNDGASWAQVGVGTLPTAPVTGIGVDPTNPNLAYVTFGGAGSYSHVWKTTNGGGSWISIQGNLPPNVPAYSVVTDPVASPAAPLGHLFLGTEVGLFVSVNQGQTWTRFGAGVPNVPVVNLEFNARLNVLTAATQGRGAFAISTNYVTPKIVSFTPTTTQVQPVSSVTVTFNEGVEPFTAKQVKISGPKGTVNATSVTDITSLGQTAHTVWQINFPAQAANGVYTFTVGPDIVDFVGNVMDQNQDGDTTSDAQDAFTFTVTVQSPQPPTISTIGNQHTGVGVPVSIGFTIGDKQTASSALLVVLTSDNQTLVPDANLVVSGTGSNRTLQITPLAGQAGVADITITVTDSLGLQKTETFKVTVNTVTITKVPNQQAVEGTAIVISAFSITDFGSNLATTFQVTPQTSPATTVSYSAGASTLTVQPPANFVGTFTVNLSAKDTVLGGSASASFTVTMIAHPTPQLTVTAPAPVSHDAASLSVPVTAKYIVAGSTLTFGAFLTNGQPNSQTAISVTPPPAGSGPMASGDITISNFGNFAGSFYVTANVTTSPGNLVAKQTFLVTITDNAPKFVHIPGTPLLPSTLTVPHTQGSATLNFAVKDADSDALTFSTAVSSVGANAGITASVANASQSGTITTGQLVIQGFSNFSGTFQVTISASDGIKSASHVITMTVTAPQPVFTLSKITVPHNPGQTTVNLTATDPEGLQITYSASLSGAPSGVTVNTTSNPVSGGVTTGQLSLSGYFGFVGKFSVTVTASNGISSTTRTVTVTVTDHAPTLAPIGPVSMSEGTSGQVTLVANDVDNDPLTFSYQAVGDNPLFDVQQKLNLYESSSGLFFNLYGRQEYWLKSHANGGWYALLPSGNLYVGNFNNAAQPLGALVASLGTAAYQNLSLLLNPTPPQPVSVDFSLNGNVLTFTPPSNYTGTFLVTVSVSDGALSATQTFLVTVS